MCVRCEKTKLGLEHAIEHLKRYEKLQKIARDKHNQAIDDCWDKT